MKRLILFALILALVISPTQVSAFTDTNDYRHRDSIDYIRDEGIVQGYSDGSYRPYDPINRAEMLKIILSAKIKDNDIGKDNRCFDDVRLEWFARYICYAKANNIIKGYADGSYKPGNNVLMVEALKMALETFEVNLPGKKSNDQWYQPYVDFAHENNIFSKYSYVPGKNISRGEMAYLIHQLLLNDKGTKKFTGQRNNRSAGCGKTPPANVATSSTINGVNQTYITDIPSSYDANTPIALTFGWHGRTNSNAKVRTYYKVYENSNGGTIMVYPAGTGGWNVNRDVAIFDQLLAEFKATYCIDIDRVFIVGHSLGSWFTNSLACIRGDVIRASGSLGGGTTQNNCSGPVAAITMHNPADRLSPFSDGIRARDLHLTQNACTQATTSYSSPDKANCVEYSECAPENPVVWCPHTEDYSWNYYYPHGWPRWTGSEIWDFFENLE